MRRLGGDVVALAGAVALAGFVAQGCGGGGGHHNTTTTVTGTSSLSGTAAQGAAIANAKITIKDANGRTRTGTTGSDGTYTIDVSGTVQPLLVKIDLTSGTSIFSVAALGSGVCNVTPLTDLVVQSYFQVLGTTAATAFLTPTSATPYPSAVQVQTIEKVVVAMVARTLQANGLDPTQTSLFTTTFTANGSGIDAVLDQTTVSGSSVTITSGGTVQTSTVSASSSTGQVTITTTTTSGGSSSSSTTSTSVPVTSDFQAAVNGVTTTLTQFAGAINSKGASLAESDITPFLASNFKHESKNGTQFADEIVTNFRGATCTVAVTGVNSFDDTTKIADVSFTLFVTPSGASTAIPQPVRMTFQLVSGSWLFLGDQRIANVQIQTEARSTQTGSSTTNSPDVNVDVSAIQSTVTGCSVTGGPFSSTALTKGNTNSKTITPNPGGASSFLVQDDFFAFQPLAASSLPAPGTAFSVTVQPASGSAVTYTNVSNGITTEFPNVTAPTTHSVAAVVGQNVTVSWTLPKTFAISTIQINAHVSDSTGSQFEFSATNAVGGNVLAPNATSAVLAFPSNMPGSGNAITSADITLSFTGTNGERSYLDYQLP